MSPYELQGKIFTFSKNVCQGITKESEELNFHQFIKNLKCMRGIDEDNIPTFKFITFKVSYIKDKTSKDDQIMLCFSDISQKILADTNKAEGELLSLINSTISHEMRNPLNSIINQCKIMFAMMKSFSSAINAMTGKISGSLVSQLMEVFEEL